MVVGKSVHSSQINEIILENNVTSICGSYSIMFPYHCFKAGKTQSSSVMERIVPQPSPSSSTNYYITGFLNSFHVFPKVYAADTSSSNSDNTINVDEKQTVSNSSGGDKQSHPFETLARMYIEKETGMERVRALFKKDHKGESSIKMLYIKFALVQICTISFFMKYVPSWKLAKQDFIREHNATTFRTSIEAVRKMSDIASLKAILEGVTFATKITSFSAGFLFLSQSISSYRNKTSVLEYTVAAGITGGIARLNMGPKGFVAGTFVGMVLGTILGCLSSAILHLTNLTEDVRHLQDVISKLEVERSIIGDRLFEEKIQTLTGGLDPIQHSIS